MRTRSVVLATPAIAALCALSACSSSAAKPAAVGGSKTLTIGVSFDQLNAIRQAELDGIKAAAATHGDKVVFDSADSDAQTQASQIQDLIQTQKVNAVIVIADNADEIQSSEKLAKASGVPFIAIDRAPTDTADVAFQITGDPAADGKLAAQQFIGAGKPLKVLELVGALTDQNAIGRRDGFNAALQGNASIQIADQVPTNWDPTQALDGTADALQKDPDINAIFIPSDFLWPSVESALKSAGRLVPAGDPKHVFIVDIDGDPNGCAAIKSQLIDADIATLVGNFGQQAVAAAHTIAAGQTVAAKTVVIAGLPLNLGNAATTESKVWGCAIAPTQ